MAEILKNNFCRNFETKLWRKSSTKMMADILKEN